MKCPRPGCENEATSKGRCFESYCEGWLDAENAAGDLIESAVLYVSSIDAWYRERDFIQMGKRRDIGTMDRLAHEAKSAERKLCRAVRERGAL